MVLDLVIIDICCCCCCCCYCCCYYCCFVCKLFSNNQVT